MNVSLNEHWKKFVQKKVSSGRYHSSSEVIREALRLLAEKDRTTDAKLKELREEIEKGRRSRKTPFNADEIIEAGRKLKKESSR